MMLAIDCEAEDSLVEIDGEEYNLACIHPLSRRGIL